MPKLRGSWKLFCIYTREREKKIPDSRAALALKLSEFNLLRFFMQPRHSERPRQASLEKPTACRRLADGMSPLSSRQKTSRPHLAKDPLIHAFFYLLDLCFYLHLYLLLFRCILLTGA